jgi:dihydroorotate dehydrogenase (fumarate)
MPGASPLADDLDMVRRLEDAGASAIVMRSLFEEQITAEQLAAHHHFDSHANSYAEALSYHPSIPSFVFGPDRYLEQIRRIRAAVAVPVIASLNGCTPGGWLEYGRLMEQAGAHAIELNLYGLPTSPDEDAAAVEARSIETVRAVTRAVGIAVAVKLSPFYSSLPAFVRRLEEAGARGVILFNRFYQPDIDVEALDVTRTLHLSDSSELLLRLHWLAVLSGSTLLSLGATGGVHTSLDVIKAIMAGASGVQMVSALLHHGPERLRTVLQGVQDWADEHLYTSFAELRGSMDLTRCPQPGAYERMNYMQILQSYHRWGDAWRR